METVCSLFLLTKRASLKRGKLELPKIDFEKEKNLVTIPTFQPLDKKRYFEQVAQLIREKILRESLQEGFRLPSEVQIANELNVSRSVVREALRILDVMGYIHAKKGPQGGIFVSSHYHKPISDSFRSLAASGQVTVDHLFDVRLQIEPFIIEEATIHAKNDDINKIAILLENAALHMDDAAQLKRANIDFHLLLAEASGNPVLSILMKSLTDILMEIAYTFLDHDFEKRLFGIHTKIFRAITEKKTKEVSKLIKADILFVRKNLKNYVERGDIHLQPEQTLKRSTRV
jgi:DNA-binding FadR family transcriptional regulator